jgi:hypothetical protein
MTVVALKPDLQQTYSRSILLPDTQVKSMSEMHKELLAQADGDGQLSEDEKSALRAQ